MQKKNIILGLLVFIALVGSVFLFQQSDRFEGYSKTSALNYPPQFNGGYAEDSAASPVGGNLSKSVSIELPAPPFEPGSSASNNTTVGEERLIIKNGQLSILVEDVPLAAQQIAQLATVQGGFVVSSNMYKYGLAPRADVTFRVPAENFDQALDQAQGIGEVESKHISGKDVTEEFVDLDAQVKNLEKTEQQFLTILEQATKIEDILSVQRELTQVRSQIERLQGRLNYLSKSAQLSTITVSLSSDPEALPVVGEKKWKPLGEVKQALRDLQKVGVSIANSVIWVVVFIPVWIILFFVGRIVWKKGKSIINK